MEENSENIPPIFTVPPPIVSPAVIAALAAATTDESGQLTKSSCHDSGIDIREPNSLPAVQQIPAKKVDFFVTKTSLVTNTNTLFFGLQIYSDADIVLSSDWVPPLTIAPSHFTESPPKSQNALTAQAAVQAQNLEHGGRKKTSSVSFSVEDNSEIQAANLEKGGETKKNKVRKYRFRKQSKTNVLMPL